MRISFLISNAYGIGGTIHATVILARTLAEHHDVEIVSVFRRRDEPVFSAGPSVPVRALVDMRRRSSEFAGDDPDHARPSRRYPRGDGRYEQYSVLTDRLIAAHLRHLDADAVIGTRPGLNVAIARHTRPGVLRIGQEHLTFATHSPKLKMALSAAYPRLDAMVTMTEAGAGEYRRLWLPGVTVASIPNGVPAPTTAPSDNTAPLIIAAGRLAPIKRFHHLVSAFRTVVEARPDWQLRIYGGGVRAASLREQVERLELTDSVSLMGAVHPLEAEWPKGSIAAQSSKLESFGMTIVEAMRSGLPVVSTDCPLGPREIITHGEDGLLVTPGKPAAMADGLLRLVDDEELRQRMGATALANSARFDPARIGQRYADLLAGLGSGHQTSLLTGTLLGGLNAIRLAGSRVASGGGTARRPGARGR